MLKKTPFILIFCFSLISNGLVILAQEGLSSEEAVCHRIDKGEIEEAVEIILAAKEDRAKEVTHEAADVLFHIMVLFAQKGIDLSNIFEELERRHKNKTENPRK